MECTNPPPLTDETLSSVADGVADVETERHLAQCPACAARLTDMKRWEARLTGHLRRFQCPSPQRLGDYYAELLEEADAEAVRQHLTDCPRCQEELKLLEAFLEPLVETPADENIIPLWTPPHMFKAQRVQTVGNLALKGLKGAEDSETHDAKAGTASIFLESTAGTTGFTLKGQILDAEVDWAGAISELRANGITQQVNILDDMAEFQFELASAGSFELFITAASGITLVVENVTIQP